MKLVTFIIIDINYIYYLFTKLLLYHIIVYIIEINDLILLFDKRLGYMKIE